MGKEKTVGEEFEKQFRIHQADFGELPSGAGMEGLCRNI